jgi:hypothetical protein
MLIVMPLAFGSAFVAYATTQLEHLAKHLFVGARSSNCELSRRFAHVRAVEARADALAHVHLLCSAGIGAAKTHPRAIHEVMRGIPKRLVDVALHVRVEADHLANGHAFLLFKSKPVDRLCRSA